MDTEWLKSQMDKLRAEASRGAVPSATVFSLTDPVMDRIARADRSDAKTWEARHGWDEHG